MGISQIPTTAGTNRQWVELATASPSAVATFNFTSISTSYYYLMVIWNSVAGSNTLTCDFTINNDTGANYAWTTIQNATTATTGNTGVSASRLFATTGTSTNSGQLFIEGANDIYKTIRFWSVTNGGAIYNNASAQWNGTASITRLDFTVAGGTFSSGTFKLLGSN